MIRRFRYGIYGKGVFPSDNLAPTNLTAEEGTTGILVSWDDNSGNESGFQIERSADEETFVLIHTTIPGVTSYEDTDESLEPDTYYYYRVRAVFKDLFSEYSNVQGSKVNPVYAFDEDGVIEPMYYSINDTNYASYVFLKNGTAKISKQIQAKILVVAGGGGGGNAADAGSGASCGGGGAGGLLIQDKQIEVGNYDVVIGDGGAGGIADYYYAGDNGENSSAFGITAIGGGGGGSSGLTHPKNGGSGGGAASSGSGVSEVGSGTVGQGNDGGTAVKYNGGGGGGASAVGGNANSTNAGNGGAGLNLSQYFTDAVGDEGFFAGGGGGGTGDIQTDKVIGTGGKGGGGNGAHRGLYTSPTNGTPNTGGGGGAGRPGGQEPVAGGDGASGIVILRIEVDTIPNFTLNENTILNEGTQL